MSNHFHLTTSVSVFPSLGVQSLPSHNISVGLPISWCPITSISQHQCRSSHLLVSNHFHLTTSVSVFPSLGVQSLPSHNNSVSLPISWCPITSISQHQSRSSHLLVSNHFHLTTSVSVFPSLGVQSLPSHNIRVGLPISWCPITSISQHQCRSSHLLVSNHLHLITTVSVFPSLGVQSLPSHNISISLPMSWCPITSISQHQCRSSHLLVSNHFHLTTSVSVFPSISVQSLPSHNISVGLPIYWCPITSIPQHQCRSSHLLVSNHFHLTTSVSVFPSISVQSLPSHNNSVCLPISWCPITSISQHQFRSSHLLVSNHFHLTTSVSVFPSLGVQSLPSHNISIGLPIYWCPITSISQHQCRSSHLLVSNHFHLTTSVSVFPSIGVQSLPSHNISVGLPISWCPITSISQHQFRSSHLLVSNHFHLTTSVSVFPSLGVQSLPSHNISIGLPIYWCPITSISQHQCRSSHLLVSNHFLLTTSVSVFPSIGVQSLPSHNISVGLPISWCPITSISQHQCQSSHLFVSNHFHLTTSVSVFPSLGVQSLPSHNISFGLPISLFPITSISQHQSVFSLHLVVSNHFHLTTSVSVFPSLGVQSLPSHNISFGLPIY